VSAKPSRSLRTVLREANWQLSTDHLEALAQACVDELRERGRSLGIEGDTAHHADALKSIEQLAGSALAVGQIAAATPANDGT
jgi:hypothetical protein